MATNLLIVEASINDVKDIRDIQKQTWLDSYPNPSFNITKKDVMEKIMRWEQEGLRGIEDRIQDSNTHTWIVKEDSNIVGFIGVVKGEKENKIEAIHVLPSHQGRGIGKKLFNTALSWLDDSKRVALEVVSYNEDAIRFYEKFGFKKHGEALEDPIVLPSGKIIPKILMVKDHVNIDQ